MIESKLDLILKNFSEANNEGKKPKSYRKSTIIRHALLPVGGQLLGAALVAPKDPSFAFALAATTPIAAAGAAFLKADSLNREQATLDLAGKEKVDKYTTYTTLLENNFIPYSPYGLDKYLPSKEVNKLNEDYKKALDKYPLNKEEKKTEEYKKNKAVRRALEVKLVKDKTDLFLNTNRIGKPLKSSPKNFSDSFISKDGVGLGVLGAYDLLKNNNDFSEESPTYEEKFKALPPHERVLQDRSFLDKTRGITQLIQYWTGPDYIRQTPRQMTREKKRSIKEIEKLKKTNEYENFLADRNAVFKPIDDAYSKAKADKTLRKYPSFYIDDSVGFADIGERTPFPNPSVLNVYVDNGYAIGAVRKYKDKDMSASNPTHPYEKLRYLPLDVQNRLKDEVLKPGISSLRAKYPKIDNLYADLDHRDKKEFRAYTKEIRKINKKSDMAYNYLSSDNYYKLQLPLFQQIATEAFKSSIDEAYERAKKEGTLLTKS